MTDIEQSLCEPPEHLRRVDDWHWLKTPTHGPVLCKWKEHQGRKDDWRWHYENGGDISDAAIEVCEWTYVGRVPSPADLTRLVEAAREIVDALEYEPSMTFSSTIGQRAWVSALSHFTAALIPFAKEPEA